MMMINMHDYNKIYASCLKCIHTRRLSNPPIARLGYSSNGVSIDIDTHTCARLLNSVMAQTDTVNARVVGSVVFEYTAATSQLTSGFVSCYFQLQRRGGC